jgi:hypothetical protein
MDTAVFLNQKRVNVCEHMTKMVVSIEIFWLSFRVPVLWWSLQFLVRVFTFLSLILCYSYFGTFHSMFSIILLYRNKTYRGHAFPQPKNMFLLQNVANDLYHPTWLSRPYSEITENSLNVALNSYLQYEIYTLRQSPLKEKNHHQNYFPEQDFLF